MARKSQSQPNSETELGASISELCGKTDEYREAKKRRKDEKKRREKEARRRRKEREQRRRDAEMDAVVEMFGSGKKTGIEAESEAVLNLITAVVDEADQKE